ncbi:MAG: hypothetical protein MI824_18715 [Hyphomicrobiales bacterium]|nr:hypothetical protein [Hyphomicrobiales bacterium]
MIEVEDHRELIDALLKEHGLSPDQFETVESVKDWCEAHNCDARESRIAMVGHLNGKPHIVIVSQMTNPMIRSIQGWMELKGLGEEFGALQTDEAILTHTVLHEIAGIVLDTGDAVKRSKWAFEQMGVEL